jgi:transcriptional regulator with GAF, ATPase, and Fis domain
VTRTRLAAGPPLAIDTETVLAPCGCDGSSLAEDVHGLDMPLTRLSDVPPTRDDAAAPTQFERLIANMSSTLVNLRSDDLPSAWPQILDQICLALRVDRGTLIECASDGSVETSHTRAGQDEAQLGTAPSDWNWLLNKVRIDGCVAGSLPGDLPIEATGEREYARRCGLSFMLGVAVSVGGGCIGALVFGSRQGVGDRQGLVQRSRFIAEIVGSALQRSRQDAALRASLAEIQRLNRRLADDNICLKDEIKTFHDFDEIVGESAAMRAALERLAQVAPLSCSVLLHGETGTGKELFARALHDRSRRRARALVRVNCAALPPTLIESELFGHEKGAFTGAVGLRQGRFELAEGGTIFLDEIGDLPFEMQGKLLRVLQEGEFERVGSSRTRRVDVRVIAATHHNLEAAVAADRFRPDLFYRLSVFPISVPPLRERREDIPSLVWFFIHHHQRELGRRIAKVPTHVMNALHDHDWPGNVRELENVVERALIRSSGDTLQLDETFAGQPRGRMAPANGTLDDMQRAHIESTLEQCGWRINGVGNAAERLGVHPNTLRFRMKKLGIKSSRQRRLSAH